MSLFCAADLLIPPQALLPAWSVIACDQFTSQPEYWQKVKALAAGKPSAYHLIFPEAELPGADQDQRIASINRAMEDTLAGGVLNAFPDSFIYLERTLLDGSIRRGVVGCIDLEGYDYLPGSQSPIRATECTVLERIPPRVHIREHASLELAHVLLLADDDQSMLIEPLTKKKEQMQLLYDFDLMCGGGHIRGYRLDPETQRIFSGALNVYERRLQNAYRALDIPPVLYAVGDGNHSLAAAKRCWEDLKARQPELATTAHPARYAMVELENIHDEAQQFEPIHRVVTHTDAGALLSALKEQSRLYERKGYTVRYATAAEEGELFLDPDSSALPVGALQQWLDRWMTDHPGSMDYIHGDDTALALGRQPDSIAFLLPAIGKADFFQAIAMDGVMPRKTFSMGHAQEKRYYLEARKII